MTADRKWMEKLGFELEDKGSMVPLWVVVDDCGGERPASLAEVVLWTSLTAPAAPIAPELDVTKIMLNVVPGYEGEGLEVYAKSVDDVVALLTKQGERIEELESRLAAPVAPAEPAKFTTIEEGTAEVVRFFTEHLRRHDFTRYIKKSLAVDFCCAIAPTLHAVMAAPVVPAEPPMITLSGAQLLDALDFVAPDRDRPDQFDQLESEVCISYRPAGIDTDGNPFEAGMCCWLSDYPEEGSIPLPGLIPTAPVAPGSLRDKAYPMSAPAAPAEPTHLHRADGTPSGVFIEPVASDAAAVAADLRNWFDFLPGHAQPTIEQAVRLLETRP